MVTACPPNVTVAPSTKLLPEIVIVKEGDPATAELGAKDAMVGKG